MFHIFMARSSTRLYTNEGIYLSISAARNARSESPRSPLRNRVLPKKEVQRRNPSEDSRSTGRISRDQRQRAKRGCGAHATAAELLISGHPLLLAVEPSSIELSTTHKRYALRTAARIAKHTRHVLAGIAALQSMRTVVTRLSNKVSTDSFACLPRPSVLCDVSTKEKDDGNNTTSQSACRSREDRDDAPVHDQDHGLIPPWT